MRELSWDQIFSGNGRPPFDDERCLPFPADPEVKVKPELVFFEGVFDDDIKGITVVPEPVGTIRVCVNANYRVIHKQAYGGGEEFDAPDDDMTRKWIESGWVSVVPAPKKAKTAE
jgi:hypothetical protein